MPHRLCTRHLVPAQTARTQRPAIRFDIGASMSRAGQQHQRVARKCAMRFQGQHGDTSAACGSYSARGVDQLKLTTTGVDVSISAVLPCSRPTPVSAERGAHAGFVHRSGGRGLDLNKVFVGVNMNLAVINIAVEATRPATPRLTESSSAGDRRRRAGETTLRFLPPAFSYSTRSGPSPRALAAFLYNSFANTFVNRFVVGAMAAGDNRIEFFSY